MNNPDPAANQDTECPHGLPSRTCELCAMRLRLDILQAMAERDHSQASGAIAWLVRAILLCLVVNQ